MAHKHQHDQARVPECHPITSDDRPHLDKTIALEAGIETTPPQPAILYASAQLHVDAEQKQLAARWIAEELPLSSGAGLFLDAGSSCLALWREILDRIRHQSYANLSVTTNSLLVLRDWITGLGEIPSLLGTSLDFAGEICDVSHLAYYGDSLREKLLSRFLRLSAVYKVPAGSNSTKKARFYWAITAANRSCTARNCSFTVRAEDRA